MRERPRGPAFRLFVRAPLVLAGHVALALALAANGCWSLTRVYERRVVAATPAGETPLPELLGRLEGARTNEAALRLARLTADLGIETTPRKRRGPQPSKERHDAIELVKDP